MRSYCYWLAFGQAMILNFSQNFLFTLTVFPCSADNAQFHEDLLNIARTTLSSKILSQHKEYFSKLAVDAVLRLKGSGNLSAIQIIKKTGGTLEDSFLDEGMNKEGTWHFLPLWAVLWFLCTVTICYWDLKIDQFKFMYWKWGTYHMCPIPKFGIWRDTSVGNSCLFSKIILCLILHICNVEMTSAANGFYKIFEPTFAINLLLYIHLLWLS